MITTYIIFVISLWIHGCRSQCAKENPFYMIDRQCANFNDICVKKDFGPCKSLLQACAQCPASNLTESALVNILTILRGSSTFNVIIIIAICVLLILVILLVLIQMRKQPCSASKNYIEIPTIYQTLPNTQNQIKTMTKASSDPRFDEIQQTLANMQNQIKTMTKPSSVTVSIKMRGFRNTIKIQINRDDNVVKVKQKICAQMTNTKSDYFKMMVLKLNETSLDDNQYLADKIRPVEDSLYCDVIENFDPSDTVVVMLRGSGGLCLPEMIQIKKSQTIEWLKSLLSQLTGVAADSLKLFSDSNEINGLDDLGDYESLRVIEMQTGQINIKSIFDKEYYLSYSNADSIGSIKKKIADSLDTLADDIILFCDSINLNDDVFVFEIDIEQLKFCHLISTEKVETTKYVMHGDFSEIFEGRNPWTKEEVVFKRYQLEPMKILKENKAFLNELIIFQKTKSLGGFVRLNGVFKEKNYFYISMEKMEGSIKDYIKKNHPLSENIIVEWAKQFLLALQYLHDHSIMHRNIKPSSIFLDNYGNIKLSSFGVAKYVYWEDKKCLMEGFQQSRLGTFRYMAPEVCNNEKYGAKADVWSFGATLIEMATGKQPFDGKDESKAIMEIGKTKQIPFELDQTRSSKLKDFIDKFLIPDPNIRRTVDELLIHEFLCPKR